MTNSQHADDLKQRLNRLIGRLGALTECVNIVNGAVKDETGLEPVRGWLTQALDELKIEQRLIEAETRPSADDLLSSSADPAVPPVRTWSAPQTKLLREL